MEDIAESLANDKTMYQITIWGDDSPAEIVTNAFFLGSNIPCVASLDFIHEKRRIKSDINFLFFTLYPLNAGYPSLDTI